MKGLVPGRITLAFAIAFLFLAFPLIAEEKPKKETDLDISGYGLFGNIELRRLLQSVDLNWKDRDYFDANFIEDAALIILSRLRRDGYLRPEITVDLTLMDNTRATYRWKDNIDPPLPRDIRVRDVHFTVHPGILFRYDDIIVHGTNVFSEKQALAFFVERGLLLPLKRTRVYTPERLERSMDNLAEALMRRGYENARVTDKRVSLDDETGRVDVEVEVNEGRQSIVRTIHTQVHVSTNSEPVWAELISTNVPFSKIWEQDLAQALRARHLQDGYPDTTVNIEPVARADMDGVTEVEVLARVQTGEQVRVGAIEFEGLERTKESVVRRRVSLEKGDLLDRIAAENSRHRLARLGIFDTVGLRYDVVDPHTRNLVYTVDEGKRLNLYLLAGYGSYELARGGFELEQYNLWGRAHQARLKAIQSLKSTSADYLYTMPEFFGEDVDFFVNGFYLEREEVTFTREEYGGGAGARTYLDPIQSHLVARYNYQVLSAFETGVVEGPTNAIVGSISFELNHDRRDSPLYPLKGYKIQSLLELASEYLGGEVNFVRFETQGSYHRPLDVGRSMHFGLSHGVIGTLHDPREDLPFNRRFFPGGDNSVRGYQYGEAAPRNADGKIVGAETYTTGNVEFEQALTDKLSLVLFVDAVGFARRIDDYPFDEFLVSSGGGLRWKTIIGPVRLEYGHNLIKRSGDPTGTVHFSIGFPF